MVEKINKVVNFAGYSQDYLIDGVVVEDIPKHLRDAMRKIYHKFREEQGEGASTNLQARGIALRLISWVPPVEHVHIIFPNDLPDFCEVAIVRELDKIPQYTPIKLVTDHDEYLAKWEKLNVG